MEMCWLGRLHCYRDGGADFRYSEWKWTRVYRFFAWSTGDVAIAALREAGWQVVPVPEHDTEDYVYYHAAFELKQSWPRINDMIASLHGSMDCDGLWRDITGDSDQDAGTLWYE